MSKPTSRSIPSDSPQHPTAIPANSSRFMLPPAGTKIPGAAMPANSHKAPILTDESSIRGYAAMSGTFHSTFGVQATAMLNANAGLFYLCMAFLQVAMVASFGDPKAQTNAQKEFLKSFNSGCEYGKNLALEKGWDHFNFTFDEVTDKACELVTGSQHDIKHNEHAANVFLQSIKNNGLSQSEHHLLVDNTDASRFDFSAYLQTHDPSRSH